MSQCIVLGGKIAKKSRLVGHNRSHANNATKRVFEVNMQKKTYTLPSGVKVRVNISTKGIRIIDKKGVAYLAQLLDKQQKGE